MEEKKRRRRPFRNLLQNTSKDAKAFSFSPWLLRFSTSDEGDALTGYHQLMYAVNIVSIRVELVVSCKEAFRIGRQTATATDPFGSNQRGFAATSGAGQATHVFQNR